MITSTCNDFMPILTQALQEMKEELGDKFSLEKINLSELQRRTGISRKKLRKLKQDGFVRVPHASKGKIAEKTVLTGYTGIIDNLLKLGVTNSSVAFERLSENGYTGGQTQVKKYISQHRDLIPAKRQQVSPQGNRGRRYSTGAGETYQMDWGFVDVESYDEKPFQAACFAMICHHCGERYIEFFTNARQENLFIGMVHAFSYMGVPKTVLTDNMRSVILGRDDSGVPIWNHDYEVFMTTLGFSTKVCKARHPFTKGSVERLVRFVKDNFVAGRTFYNLTDLNEAALNWCNKQNAVYHRAVDCVPDDKHDKECMTVAHQLETTQEISMYLCPERTISFDGFVNYEGRRYGVPYSYTDRTCRVKRDGSYLNIYDRQLTKRLVTHAVTWSYKDSFCEDQYLNSQPEELPTAPITVSIRKLKAPEYSSSFSRYNFDKEDDNSNA